MSVSRSLQGLHRNIVVIVTALIALVAMHGLSSDHAIGVPTDHSMTSMEASSSPVGELAAAQRKGVEASPMAAQMAAAVTTTVASMSDQMGHASGMCVGILDAAVLLWLLGRSARRRLATMSVAVFEAVRVIPARDGPPTAIFCPSLVQLCILRT